MEGQSASKDETVFSMYAHRRSFVSQRFRRLQTLTPSVFAPKDEQVSLAAEPGRRFDTVPDKVRLRRDFPAITKAGERLEPRSDK